jgi:hypothetical protein
MLSIDRLLIENRIDKREAIRLNKQEIESYYTPKWLFNRG